MTRNTHQLDNQLRAPVMIAAEQAFERQRYVSVVDVFLGMDLLQPSHLANWRKGRLQALETMIQGRPTKRALVLEICGRWARMRDLVAEEIRYTRRGRDGDIELRLTESGDPEAEKAYRTVYVPAKLTAAKRKSLLEKVNAPPEEVVFSILRESSCSECGATLGRGAFLYKEGEDGYCLGCAGLDDLEYLPAGDAALTRRSKKYSGRTAVVVRFSRTRGRYERQGILVEADAVERAEAECSADAEERAAQRVRAAGQRKRDDTKLVTEMTRQIVGAFPGCPPDEARAIAAHTAVRGSGRVGRTAAGRALKPDALLLAVCAAVRHRHTHYDKLLGGGEDRRSARSMVQADVKRILQRRRGGG